MSDLDLFAGIGWRDLVLVAAGLIGVYLALSVLRLFRVAGRRPPPAAPAAPGFPAWQPDIVIEPEPTAQPPAPPDAAPEVAVPAAFAEELARINVEAECRALRRECTRLREDLDRLAGELAQLKATGGMSPLYGEALAMARRGLPADGIAGRCGISVAEAELVAALARGADGQEQKDYDGDGDERDRDFATRAHG